LIATADSDPYFFMKIVTGDETRCFAYDPTTKRQSNALDIQKAMTSTLNTIAKDDFYNGIQKLYDRANLCVQLEGMYVEN